TFGAVLPNERFDTIYWNMPFIYVGKGYSFRNMLERSLFDPGYKSTKAFLREAPRHLKESGRFLIGFGDFGDVSRLISMTESVGYSCKELMRGSDLERQPITFILYELTLP